MVSRIGEARIHELLSGFDKSETYGFVSFSSKELRRLPELGRLQSEKLVFNVSYIPIKDSALDDADRIVSSFKKNKIFKVHSDGTIDLPASLHEQLKTKKIELNFRNLEEQQDKIHQVFKAQPNAPVTAKIRQMSKEEEAEFNQLKNAILQTEFMTEQQRQEIKTAKENRGSQDVRREEAPRRREDEQKGTKAQEKKTAKPLEREDSSRLHKSEEDNRRKEVEKDRRDMEKREFYKEKEIKEERLGH